MMSSVFSDFRKKALSKKDFLYGMKKIDSNILSEQLPNSIVDYKY